MSEIVNLRLARKRKDRAAREVAAAANRIRHGQTTVARKAVAAEAEKIGKLLDGARRDPPD